MLRRSKPNVLLLGREISWLDLKRAVPRNAIETELRKRGCLDRVKFIFFRHALVWFAVALEAVLEFAVAFGKLRHLLCLSFPRSEHRIAYNTGAALARPRCRLNRAASAACRMRD
jgi:hypothetical protein